MEQRRKNLEKHMDSLRAKSNLQYTISNANRGIYDKNTVKELSKVKTAAELLRDTAAQREIALGHIAEIFKNAKDQTEFLQKLESYVGNGVEAFNHHYLSFMKEVGKSISGMTPAAVAILFRRFIEKKSKEELFEDLGDYERTLIAYDAANQDEIDRRSLEASPEIPEPPEEKIDEERLRIARAQSLHRDILNKYNQWWGNNDEILNPDEMLDVMDALVKTAPETTNQARMTDELLNLMMIDIYRRIIQGENAKELRKNMDSGFASAETALEEAGLYDKDIFEEKSKNAYDQLNQIYKLHKEEVKKAEEDAKEQKKAKKKDNDEIKKLIHDRFDEGKDKQEEFDYIYEHVNEIIFKALLDNAEALRASGKKDKEIKDELRKTASVIKTELKKHADLSDEDNNKEYNDTVSRVRAVMGLGIIENHKIGLTANYPFGKYLLNDKQLLKNVLHVRGKKGGAIKKFPKTPISNKLKEIIMGVSDGNQPSQEQYDQLTEHEAELFDRLVHASFNSKNPSSIERKVNKKIDADIERYELVRGEIMSGNNNPELIRELKILILKLMKQGILSKVEGMDVLLVLCSL
jgi:hypothetical protein